MSRKVLFLTQWFEPEPAHKGLKFVQALRDRGYDVEVLTGFPNYPTGIIMPGYRLGAYRLEIMDGVKIHRVFLYPSHSKSSIGRSLNYLSFFVSSLAFCLFRGRRFDAVYVYHPPVTSALAVALSRIVSRRPYVVDVQDLWPDAVAVSGMKGSGTAARVLGPVCSYIYRRAAVVMGQSESMTQRLVERGADPRRATTTFNWADEDSARPHGTLDMTTFGFAGRFNFVYGGNLGRVQGLETLVQAAVEAGKAVPEILLTLIGDGTERDSLVGMLAALGSDNVQIRPAVPQSQIGDVFSAADVLVLHLLDQPAFEVTIPSKTQFYLACGKPVLAAIRGEARDIVISAGAGVAATPGDVQSIAAAMVDLARRPRPELEAMAANARRTYAERFSFAAASDRIAATIGQVFDDAA